MAQIEWNAIPLVLHVGAPRLTFVARGALGGRAELPGSDSRTSHSDQHCGVSQAILIVPWTKPPARDAAIASNKAAHRVWY